MGFAVRPPHVNYSLRQFAAVYRNGEPVLYMGLDQVRDLTRRTQEQILRYRPFHSLAEFLLSVNPRSQEVENLVQVGAFDGLGMIPDLLRELSTGSSRPGQLTLFRMSETFSEDWDIGQKAAAQQRLLGASLDAHPLEAFAAQVHAAGVISTVDAAAKPGEVVRVAGMRQILHRTTSSSGERMAIITLEDLEGILDVILPSVVFLRMQNVLASTTLPLVIEGRIERDENTGEPVLYAQKGWQISRQETL